MPNSILLLEDEQAIADTIIYAFESDGFCVMHCGTCQDAEEQLRTGKYDFGVFDVGLPDGTGFDLCKQVRTFSQIPILFLTARSDEIDRVVGLEIGGDDYVTKPFSPRELVARVKAIMRRTSGTTEAPVSASPVVDKSGLVHNIQNCSFSYDGSGLEFTKAEYQLLRALYEQPARVFSRDQLLDEVSDDYGAAMDRVIDAHVKAIRAKLRIAQAPDVIETRRGLGYAYNANL